MEQSRQNFLNQQLQGRQQELGEVNAMFGIGQGPVPQYPQPVQPGVAPVNSLGYEAQQDSNRFSSLNPLASLGVAAGFAFSGPRMKKDMEQIGGLYRYRYKGEPESSPKRIGVMADEVERVAPEMVRRDQRGRMMLNTQAVQAMLSPQGYRRPANPTKGRCCSKRPPGARCGQK